MDYSAAKFWFDVIQTVLIGVIGLQNWLGKRQAVTEATIDRLENDLDSKLDAQSERLTRVEQDLHHVPDHNDFKRVHQRLDNVNGELKELKGEFHSVRRTLEMIHNYLMDKK